MRYIILAALTLFALMQIASPAFPITLRGESRTYLRFRETFNSKRLNPFYEYLDLNADNLGRKDLSFHFGGWVRKKSKDDEGLDREFNSDLQYAYLGLKKDSGNRTMNVGRIFVIEGVAAEQVDGIYARTDLTGGFGVAAFGGVPVEGDFDKRRGDSIYGTRATHGIPKLYTLGVSYLKENNSSEAFREEAGLDIRCSPAKKMQFLGRSSYNNLVSGWMEHAYSMQLGPFSGFRLTPEFSWVDYKNYFSSSTSGVFTLLKGIIDPAETVLTAGGSADYAVTDNITASADYRRYSYDIAGNSDYYGGKIAYSILTSGGAGISVHRMNGETDRLKYSEFRAYVFRKVLKADLTLDLFNVNYDSSINGRKYAYAASAAAGYNFTEKARVAADIEYARNPFFNREVKALIKFLYKFSTLKEEI